MAQVITKGARAQAGEIPGNGCLAVVTDQTLRWIFRSATVSEVGAGTEYPVGLSLDELMEVYWRWRKLKISITATDHLGSPYVFSKIVQSPAASEAMLVKPAVYYDIQFGYPYHLLEIFGGTVAVKYHALKYYPYLNLQHNPNTVSSVSTTGSGGTPYDATIKMSNGVEKVIPMKAYNLTNVQLLIEATEYWPHEKPDGTPKFSTTTGLRI